MRIAALVPINALSQAKSRLREALGDSERRALVCWMAVRVLRAVRESGVVESVAVISPDAAVLRLAEVHGTVGLRQAHGGLNDGLELGRRWAEQRGFDAILALLADLPLLTAQDVRALIASGTTGAVSDAPGSVVLAPDRAYSGTNGLLLRPATGFPFAFGVESLARHRALAEALGVVPTVFESAGTRFDVDTVADLRALADRGLWTPCAAETLTPTAKGDCA